MCGIFGWIPSSRTETSQAVRAAGRLGAALAHRGPDDRGWAVFGSDGRLLGTEADSSGLDATAFALLLGHTRLSIIDRSPAGHQPMRSADGRYTLVYNGEIYNYRELRMELERLGVGFQSQTDSEVLLHALIQWGTECLTRLTGMFAFVFFDAEERTLLLGRDFFGIKPLYYHHGSGGFFFASEIPGLLAFPTVSAEPAAQQVYNYLCFGIYDKGGETFFKHIRQVPPGHALHFSFRQDAEPILSPYWKPDLTTRSRLSFEEAAAHLRELFLDSVRLHLRSDVPVGVALSGGIDSSAVACAVRCLQPEAELHAFSFIAKNSPESEEQWATLVAQHTNATRHIVEVEPHELARDMDDLIRAQGEPFASTSIYAQYRVFRLAGEQGIPVTLDGQGADELLAGYWGYPGERMATLLRKGDMAGAARFFRAKKSWPGCSAKNVLFRTVREFTPDWLMPLALSIIGRSPQPDWLDIQALRREGVSFRLPDERELLYPGERDKVRQTLATQIVREGLQQLLRHGDRNAMAHSIESRVPFLTREIAEFCLSLPEEYLIDMNGRTKSVFREAMRGIVPDAVLDRRDKIGFATPERKWLDVLTPWVEETLSAAGDIPYIAPGAVHKEWKDIKAKANPFDSRVWRWLNYIRWIQIWKI